MTDEGRYSVDIAPAAAREIRRLPPGEAARLRGPILSLGLEPRPYGAVAVRGTAFWRIRVGQLRVVYVVDEAEQRVTIVRVARRSESTYRRLRDEERSRHQPTQEPA